MALSLYRPLTGKRRIFHMFAQLYVAPDHLMQVRSNRFEERYQRFYYKDIQALVVTALPSRVWLQTGLGVLAAACLVLALTAVSNPFVRALLGVFAIFPAVVALIDYFRGQRCRLIVKTATSNEPLPAVSRMPTALRVISALKPAIEQAQQAAWTPEMLPYSGPPVMAPLPPSQAPADRLVVAVFTLLSLEAGVLLAVRITNRYEIFILLAYTVVTELILAITALRRRGGDPQWVLFALTGAAIACLGLDLLGSLGLAAYYISFSPSQMLQLPYPQFLLWWAFGWRALIAVTGWISYLWGTPEPAAPTGGEPSPQ